MPADEFTAGHRGGPPHVPRTRDAPGRKTAYRPFVRVGAPLP
ncbi:hypothetical protein F750_1181 [Streptomyces sp. PAMC 26508]|nr:hypothetical protein F750_1181 [Streptomyces sp. PAMC 26508]